jgi:hypothetical protein
MNCWEDLFVLYKRKKNIIINEKQIPEPNPYSN